MVLLVADDVIVLAADCGQDAEIGLEPGRKGHDRLFFEEVRKVAFQRGVERERAVQKTGAGAAAAILPQRRNPRLDDARMHGQAKVVVGAQHDAPLALHHNLHVLPRFELMKIGIDSFFPRNHSVLVQAFCQNVHEYPLF